MMVNEEIAALEIMDIDPVRFIVMPRMAAMALRIVQGGIRRVFASEGALRVAMFIRRMFI